MSQNNIMLDSANNCSMDTSGVHQIYINWIYLSVNDSVWDMLDNTTTLLNVT